LAYLQYRYQAVTALF